MSLQHKHVTYLVPFFLLQGFCRFSFLATFFVDFFGGIVSVEVRAE